MSETLFDLEEVGLDLTPTEAMKNGTQTIHQCARCGAIVVWHEGGYRTALGLCPACGRNGGGKVTGDSQWWGQPWGVAGISRLEPSATARLRDALGYLEQTMYANDGNSESVTWTNADVLAMLSDIHDRLRESADLDHNEQEQR